MAPAADTTDDPVSGFTDDELTALALAADPARGIDEDAVPLSVYLDQAPGDLPSWYMPPPTTRGPHGRWRLPIVLVVVAGFLLVEATGLCVTFGQLVVG